MDKFYEKYKQQTARQNTNLSQCYKRVWWALSKYPLPILDAKQALILEGVGENVAKLFFTYIKEREEEFQSAQKTEDQSISLTFKQKIIAEDHKLNSENNNKPLYFKKRKIKDIEKDSGDEDEEVQVKSDKRKKAIQGFLDIGSTTWSMLLACYFISLHQGSDPTAVSFDEDSIKNMLTIMHKQSREHLPLQKKFESDEFDRLIKADLINRANESEYILSEKGLKKVEGLCKNAGILAEISKIPGSNSSNKLNSVTISLFDKEMLPRVAEFANTTETKREALNKEEQDNIFSDFSARLEDAIVTGKSQFGSLTNEQRQANHRIARLGYDQNDDTVDLIINDIKDEYDETLDPDIMNWNSGLSENKSDQGICRLVLYIDNREIRNQQDRKYLYNKLQDARVNWEQKNLPLGDFLWVIRVPRKYVRNSKKGRKKGKAKTKAKNEQTLDPEIDKLDDNEESKSHLRTFDGDNIDLEEEGEPLDPRFVDFRNPDHYDEYVLDIIIERKTGNDLASSIRDGRYDEQKNRLKNSGINNIIYLIEGKATKTCNLPEKTLETAQLHTRVYNGFNILKTSSDEDTLKRLQYINKYFETKLSNLSVDEVESGKLMEYDQFSKDSSKNTNLTLDQVFARQIRNIKGLGIENTTTIVKVFKTPHLLYASYVRCKSENQALNLLNSAKLMLLRCKTLGLDETEIDLKDVIQNSKPSNYKEFLANLEAKNLFKKVNATNWSTMLKLFTSKSYVDEE